MLRSLMSAPERPPLFELVAALTAQRDLALEATKS